MPGCADVAPAPWASTNTGRSPSAGSSSKRCRFASAMILRRRLAGSSCQVFMAAPMGDGAMPAPDSSWCGAGCDGQSGPAKPVQLRADGDPSAVLKLRMDVRIADISGPSSVSRARAGSPPCAGITIDTYRGAASDEAWATLANTCFADLGKVWTAAMFARTYAEDVAFDPNGFFLATADGEPAGSCFAWPLPDGPRVHWLCVAQSHRRRGLARVLLQRVLDYYCERGVTQVHLIVESSRLPAIALYRSHGFQPTPRSAAEAHAWDLVLAQVPTREQPSWPRALPSDREAANPLPYQPISSTCRLPFSH
eukprot:m.95545 g.95545  ORF g.95545 m.95545 type:complete len:309 (+) comp8605_c0_seq2:587-1513(+)